MYAKLGNVSNESVKNTTGKSWDEWINVIDSFGGEKLTHKEIAKRLYEDKYIQSSWWCQSVTVGYEYAKNRRVIGETKDVGFEIGVQKMLPIQKDTLWKFLLSPKGKTIWVGDATVEVKTMKPGERLRVSWKPPKRMHATTLQITLLCKRNTPEKTNINFHQEKLSSMTERTKMRKHWQTVIEEICTHFTV